MIEFLINNAVLVTVGIVIIIMAIIGYFAENSELGKKVMKPAKKEKIPKTTQKQQKPQTFEDAMGQLDKNATLATISENAMNKTNNINEGIMEQPTTNDAWSSNVDTNIEKPQEVVENNPDEWLNAPIDLVESSENTVEQTNDYLYDLPTNDSLAEVSIKELPTNDEYDGIEVLDVSDDYEDIEVLDVVKQTDDNLQTNSVEDTLVQLDNSNDYLEEVSTNDELDNNENSENTNESDDIWK